MSISLQTLYDKVMRKKKRHQKLSLRCQNLLIRTKRSDMREREREDLSVFSNHDHKVTVGALPPYNHKLCCHNVAFESPAYR